ncbi:MAG: pentapeptide repeat-containing protein [Caulobacteraceae bacterium]|nr:pentapeptide repeat-containing protein [Caulobacteraceae bacterium]
MDLVHNKIKDKNRLNQTFQKQTEFTQKPTKFCRPKKYFQKYLTIQISLCYICIIINALNQSKMETKEQAIVSCAAQGDKDFTGMNLAGADFTGANLAGCDFTSSDLSGANFTGANLAGANFTYSDLEETNFSGANLADAIFCTTYMLRANLTGANLAGASFRDSNLTGANLAGATNANTEGARCLVRTKF